MVYILGAMLLTVLTIGELHTLLKKKTLLSLNNSQSILLCLSPAPYGILVFILESNTVPWFLNTGLNIVILLSLIVGLFLYSLKHQTYWAICYLPVTITGLCTATSIAFYLNYQPDGIEPDSPTLPNFLDRSIDLLTGLSFYLWLAVPIMVVFSVIYHRFARKRPIHFHKDVLFVLVLLMGAVILSLATLLVIIKLVE